MLTELMAVGDIQEILTRNSVGRLACSQDDQPYIVLMSYVYDGNHLYGFATEGQKTRWMRSNPKVCFEVDEISDRLQWASIVLKGHYRELIDSPQFAKDRIHAQKVLASRSLWWEPALSFRRLKTAGRFVTVLYTIEIYSMTGYRTVTKQAHKATSVSGNAAT